MWLGPGSRGSDLVAPPAPPVLPSQDGVTLVITFLNGPRPPWVPFSGSEVGGLFLYPQTLLVSLLPYIDPELLLVKSSDLLNPLPYTPLLW